MFRFTKKPKTIQVVTGCLEIDNEKYSFSINANQKKELLGFVVRGKNDSIVTAIQQRLEVICKMNISNPGLFIMTDLAVTLNIKTTDITMA